jgi:hypothetical protein
MVGRWEAIQKLTWEKSMAISPKRGVMRNLRVQLLISFLLIANSFGYGQHRKVIINQDCWRPGGQQIFKRC